jgi:hypothetical protein
VHIIKEDLASLLATLAATLVGLQLAVVASIVNINTVVTTWPPAACRQAQAKTKKQL